MANEISISALLSFLKQGLAASFSFNVSTPARFTMAGQNYIHRTQTVDSTGVALDLSALDTPGFALLVNRSSSNDVSLYTFDVGDAFALFKPGEPALLRLHTDMTAPFAIQESVAITAATNANPVKLTAVAHGLSTGATVIISGFTGDWTPCNGSFTVTVTSVNEFTIPVNSTAFGAVTGTPVFHTITSLEYLILED